MMIVAIEGLDAAGKATQARMLAKRLGGGVLSFPAYHTPSGELIDQHLKGQWWSLGASGGRGGKRDAQLFQMLQTINRYELLPVIRSAQRAGTPIVFDRYCAAGLVYGEADGLDPAWIRGIQSGLPEPDAWILIDVSIVESVKRRPDRRDYYERNLEKLERVRGGYLRLFNEQRRAREHEAADRVMINNRWHVVDGHGTVEEVHTRILKVLGVQ